MVLFLQRSHFFSLGSPLNLDVFLLTVFYLLHALFFSEETHNNPKKFETGLLTTVKTEG